MPTRKRGYIKTDMKNERYIKARQIALDEDTGGAITEADGGDGLFGAIGSRLARNLDEAL